VVEFTKGDKVLENVPAVPENTDGFAGVWESYVLSNKDITVNATYGNGSESNPYMVSTANQFKKILNDYTKLVRTDFLDASGQPCAEDEAVVKNVIYKTVTITYHRQDTSADWNLESYNTHKVYFKLLENIDLSTIASDLQQLNLYGRYFCGEIDGQGHTISGIDGSLFTGSYGAMFDNVVAASFKNINLSLGASLGTLVRIARGGNTVFENIVVENTNPTIITADDNNESVFLNFALGASSVSFRNCVNNANFISYSGYGGLFVGGYAKDDSVVTFTNCVNNGNVVSRGVMGLFFGNPTYKPASYSITNCSHNGKLVSNIGSHILAPEVSGSSGAFGDTIDNYDYNESGVISGIDDQSFASLETAYTATINDSNITISSTTVKAGHYQLILSAYAGNPDGSTVLTNIVINQTKDADDANSVVFEKSYYGMMDLNTYNASSLTNKIDSQAVAEADWTKLEGYNIRYFVDETNGLYVFDYSGYDNAYVLNASASKLQKSVVYTGSDTIEFIVNFENN